MSTTHIFKVGQHVLSLGELAVVLKRRTIMREPRILISFHIENPGRSSCMWVAPTQVLGVP